MSTPQTTATYSTATDADVMKGYAEGCDAESRLMDSGQTIPAILVSTIDAWMNEAIHRGLI